MIDINKNQSILEKEIVEGLSTIRTQYTLLTQIVTIVFVANVSLVGYGFTSGHYGIFYLSSICPLMIIFAQIRTYNLMLPILYSVFRLEQQLNLIDLELLGSTYIAISFPGLYKAFNQIHKKHTQDHRMDELKKLNHWYSYFRSTESNFNTSLLCLLGVICQLIMPMILHHFGLGVTPILKS